MDFKIKNGEKVRTVVANKAAETVIEAGDLVGIAGGLVVKATASSAELAYAPNGAGVGETTVEISIGNDFTLVGTADEAFADAKRGTACDLVVIQDGEQQIDLGETLTKVLKVSPSASAGVVGSAENVEVKIDKPIF